MQALANASLPSPQHSVRGHVDGSHAHVSPHVEQQMQRLQSLLAEARGQLEEKKQALAEERRTLTDLKEFEQKLLKQLHDVTLVCSLHEHHLKQLHDVTLVRAH
jgi:hypothetical protein